MELDTQPSNIHESNSFSHKYFVKPGVEIRPEGHTVAAGVSEFDDLSDEIASLLKDEDLAGLLQQPSSPQPYFNEAEQQDTASAQSFEDLCRELLRGDSKDILAFSPPITNIPTGVDEADAFPLPAPHASGSSAPSADNGEYLLAKSPAPSIAGSSCHNDGSDLTGCADSNATVGKPSGRTPSTHKKNLRDTRSLDKSNMSKDEIEELRKQKRMAKNRRTAAESRERKKAAAAELDKQVEALKRENAELKQKLAYQEMHSQVLRDELASLTRGAKEGTTATAAPDPAESVSINYTLPSVTDRQAVVPSSSNMTTAPFVLL
eukprot:scaffold56602_cov36-Prasinocladus_malaysianus.AAC.1